MKYTLLSLGLVAVFSLSACDDGKVFGDGLDEKTLISEIELTNVENGKLTLAATVDYTDSLITYKYSPEQPSNPKVKWTSSNEKVATVSQDGLVHAVSAGKANIMITPEVGFGATALFELTVVPEFKPITDFEFTEADKAELFASEERTLKPTILPADRTYSTITWKSSDTSIATVTKDGVVRGVDGGEEGRTVTITAVSLDRGGYEESFELKIMPIIYIDEITFGTQEDLLPGESVKLNFTTYPENATVASLTWTSSDPNVVEVSDQGVVTAKKYGEVTIMAATTMGQEFSTTVKVPKGLIKEDFDGETTSWFTNFKGASGEIKDGKFVVTMGSQNNEKWRGDIALSLDGKKTENTFVDPDNYPYVAIKISGIGFEGGTGNFTFDTSLGTYKKNGANGHEIMYGTDQIPVYYYDLTIENTFVNKSGATTLDGVTEFKTFQFKVADVLKSKYPAGKYEVYWIRTFKTKEALTEYVNANN